MNYKPYFMEDLVETVVRKQGRQHHDDAALPEWQNAVNFARTLFLIGRY